MKKALILFIILLSLLTFSKSIGLTLEFSSNNFENSERFYFDNFTRVDFLFMFANVPIALDNYIEKDIEKIVFTPYKEFNLNEIHLGLNVLKEKINNLELRFAVETPIKYFSNFEKYIFTIGTGFYINKDFLIQIGIKESLQDLNKKGFQPNFMLGFNLTF
ncbi:hypothetical protein OF820_04560 [Oceanotoga sp. DSM 15011]|uniref:hypothetical protein n=1 Tax=Oceanotoga sp. DSM 15011 TaxID=2984951 RepID=UPI0021F4D193|nr:hypothetical protein [Oceanotoga sp. DSM 15011]UYP00958.1 hypothetical protein OF820_04560 [Oceanotoga sp. DSM 15011]